MAFQIYIAYKESYLCDVIAAEHNSSMSLAIQDFDLLLESVIPHKYFTRFIAETCPEKLPYIMIIRKGKYIMGKIEELNFMIDDHNEKVASTNKGSFLKRSVTLDKQADYDDDLTTMIDS